MTVEAYYEERGGKTKRLPEGSKAETIHNDIVVKVAEITSAIEAGNPSLARLEAKQVGQRILGLFDELLNELPDDTTHGLEAPVLRLMNDQPVENATLLKDNRSERFWEIDSEIGVLMKKFNELYEQQAEEPVIHTDGFVVNPDETSVH